MLICALSHALAYERKFDAKSAELFFFESLIP